MADVVFIDSVSHYTTVSQAKDKYAFVVNAPSAGTGAFSTPGIACDVNALNNQYNFEAAVEREFSVYLDTPIVDVSRNLWALFDNTFPQLFADIQPDGSIKIFEGALVVGGAFNGFPTRGSLIGTVPAATLQFNVQNLHKVSILHDATGGTLDYLINGISVLSLTGINTAPSTNDQSTILYIGYLNILPGIPGSSASIISHLVIADEIGVITGNPRTGGLFPDGVGNSSDWAPSAGNNWENVEETTPDDDSTYNESDTVNDIDTYTMQDVPSGTTAIVAVAVTVRIRKTDANSRTVAAVLRIGGTDYVHATAKGVPGGYAYLQWVWTLSPATGVAFTAAEVNGLEAGIKVVS